MVLPVLPHYKFLLLASCCLCIVFCRLLCSSSSFNLQVPLNGPPFSAITNSFILHLKLYGTKEHLPPTHLAMYSIHCLNMPSFLPLQCNIFSYYGPEQMIKNALRVMLRVTYYWVFSRNFGDLFPTSLVSN